MDKKLHEIVFEGHHNLIRGFIEGFLLSRSSDRRKYFFNRDVSIQAETLSEIIKEWVTMGTKLHHVIMEDSLFRAIKKALSRKKPGGLLDASIIKSAKAIKNAVFDFKFITYGEKYAAEVKKLIEKHPQALTLKNYNPIERIDETARGIEMYAPEHQYVFEGKGSFSGPLLKIMEYRGKLESHPLIDVSKITLIF